MRLADLRRKLGIRQADLGLFSQSAISRLESRSDMKLSTLAAYLDALDLGMEIRAYRRNGKTSERSEVVLLRT
jgi:transcriptional regulator with XRE-family HTH domain